MPPFVKEIFYLLFYRGFPWNTRVFVGLRSFYSFYKRCCLRRAAVIYYKYKRRSVVLDFRKDIAMELDTNNHSVFMLNYHLIMCVKYRNNVIDDAISLRLKEIFKNICLNYNISLEEWNHDKDHVHVLFRGQPNSEISKFINAYKSASSRLIKKEYPEIKKHLWKDMFWSQSYCLISTGGVTVDIIKEYIQTQGRR